MEALRIGTRGSTLALWQANHLRGALDHTCGVSSEVVVVMTSGDHFVGVALEQIGIRGVFTKELEDAILDERVDLAVHSMKDIPTDLPDVCRVAVVFPREDPRDALVSRDGKTLEELPRGARIGTSSLRRAAQLRRFRRDFEIVELRGNVDTRLRRMESGACDAVVLAKAGMDRLGLTSRITEVLSADIVLPAVGQGALGVEFLERRADEFSFLDRLVDQETMRAVKAERTLLAELEGGCRLPLGAWARFERGRMVLDACVLPADGSECLRRRIEGACSSSDEAESLGRSLGRELLGAGAERLLRLAGRTVGQS